MPELPEVEAVRRCIEASVRGSLVENILLAEQGGGPLNGEIDSIVLGDDIDGLKKALLGRELLGVSRKGKYMWFDLEGSNGVLFHFGMTGCFLIQGEDVPQYKSFSVSDFWPPKFTKLELIFSNGKHLAFVDPRRLGKAKVLSQPAESSEPVASLARDPYTEGISIEEFRTQLSRYSAPIKSILLDQQKVCCGIGNYLADEVLYQSGIHPLTPANALTPEMVHHLAQCIDSVIRIAVDAKADYRKFPENWIFHCRWGKGKSGSMSIKTASGKNEAISFVTVGGRTSAVVLAVQKLPGKDVKQTTVMDAKRLERGKSASSNFEKQVRLETDSELFNSPLNEELAESETTSGVGVETPQRNPQSKKLVSKPKNIKTKQMTQVTLQGAKNSKKRGLALIAQAETTRNADKSRRKIANSDNCSVSSTPPVSLRKLRSCSS